MRTEKEENVEDVIVIMMKIINSQLDVEVKILQIVNLIDIVDVQGQHMMHLDIIKVMVEVAMIQTTIIIQSTINSNNI